MTMIAGSKDALAQAACAWKKPSKISARNSRATHRPRECHSARPYSRRLSRHADAGQSAGLAVGARADDDCHRSLGPKRVPLIDKAIRTSDLGFNPTNDGKVVRVPIPPLTEDRRKDMVKHLHKVLENHRTAVRNIRRDIKEAIEKLEKKKPSAKTNASARWKNSKNSRTRKPKKSKTSAP
jgi:hypothetical protein